jgi:acyl-CoA hydrolase
MADVPVTRLVELVGPADANHHGTLFGGATLALLATAGAIAASRHSRRQVMVVRSDRISFRVAVPVGSLVDLAARVVSTTRTIMQAEVEMVVEDALTGSRRRATSGTLGFIGLDEDGRPAAVEPVGEVAGLEDEPATAAGIIVFPRHVDEHGTLALAAAEHLVQSAALAAALRAHRRPLGVEPEELEELQDPPRPGELAEATARLLDGDSVVAELWAEDLQRGQRRRIGGARLDITF